MAIARTEEQNLQLTELKEFYCKCLEGESSYDLAHDLLYSKFGAGPEGDSWKLPACTELPREAHLHAFVFASDLLGGECPADLVEIRDDLGLSTAEWFSTTDPQFSQQRLNAQFGCHLEEVAEMLQEVSSGSGGLDAKMLLTKTLLEEIAAEFKSGSAELAIVNADKFADSLFDQKVTLTGTAVLAGVSFAEGEARVDLANFTKFSDGKPHYKVGGKVDKGPWFLDPVTTGLAGG